MAPDKSQFSATFVSAPVASRTTTSKPSEGSPDDLSLDDLKHLIALTSTNDRPQGFQRQSASRGGERGDACLSYDLSRRRLAYWNRATAKPAANGAGSDGNSPLLRRSSSLPAIHLRVPTTNTPREWSRASLVAFFSFTSVCGRQVSFNGAAPNSRSQSLQQQQQRRSFRRTRTSPQLGTQEVDRLWKETVVMKTLLRNAGGQRRRRHSYSGFRDAASVVSSPEGSPSRPAAHAAGRIAAAAAAASMMSPQSLAASPSVSRLWGETSRSAFSSPARSPVRSAKRPSVFTGASPLALSTSAARVEETNTTTRTFDSATSRTGSPTTRGDGRRGLGADRGMVAGGSYCSRAEFSLGSVQGNAGEGATSKVKESRSVFSWAVQQRMAWRAARACSSSP